MYFVTRGLHTGPLGFRKPKTIVATLQHKTHANFSHFNPNKRGFDFFPANRPPHSHNRNPKSNQVLFRPPARSPRPCSQMHFEIQKTGRALLSAPASHKRERVNSDPGPKSRPRRIRICVGGEGGGQQTTVFVCGCFS